MSRGIIKVNGVDESHPMRLLSVSKLIIGRMLNTGEIVSRGALYFLSTTAYTDSFAWASLVTYLLGQFHMFPSCTLPDPLMCLGHIREGRYAELIIYYDACIDLLLNSTFMMSLAYYILFLFDIITYTIIQSIGSYQVFVR